LTEIQLCIKKTKACKLKKIIFVSGIHGAGKGTLCTQLSSVTGLSKHSCSQIIKDNSNYKESNKLVSSAEVNQATLLHGISTLKDNNFLLDGHFCLLAKDHSIIEIDDTIFTKINPYKIIHVTCNENIIEERLKKRDGCSIDINILKEMQNKETAKAKELALKLSVPIYEHKSGKSISRLSDWLKRS
jgi:adenylate kinase